MVNGGSESPHCISSTFCRSRMWSQRHYQGWDISTGIYPRLSFLLSFFFSSRLIKRRRQPAFPDVLRFSVVDGFFSIVLVTLERERNGNELRGIRSHSCPADSKASANVSHGPSVEAHQAVGRCGDQTWQTTRKESHCRTTIERETRIDRRWTSTADRSTRKWTLRSPEVSRSSPIAKTTPRDWIEQQLILRLDHGIVNDGRSEASPHLRWLHRLSTSSQCLIFLESVWLRYDHRWSVGVLLTTGFFLLVNVSLVLLDE